MKDILDIIVLLFNSDAWRFILPVILIIVGIGLLATTVTATKLIVAICILCLAVFLIIRAFRKD